MLQITISKRSAFLVLLAVLMVIPVAAYAGSVFDDVDDDATHIAGITFMSDSGVSVGCGGNDYCPDDDVTRAQMGTFLYRLSGNDPNTAPSVYAADSETVGGYYADELVRFAGDAVDSSALSGVDGIAASVDIVAPGPGFLVISASSDVYNLTTDDPSVRCSIEVDATTISASIREFSLDVSENPEEDCSTDAFFTSLFGGEYTVDFVYIGVDADTIVDETVLNVIYIPFNGDGGLPELVLLGSVDQVGSNSE